MSDTLHKEISAFKRRQGYTFPNAAKARHIVRRLFEVLFISRNEADSSEFEIRVQLRKLEKQLQTLLYSLLPDKAESQQQAALFFEKVPSIYKRLLSDADALLQADPAAHDLSEVLIAYPGFFAIAVHRFAHQLYQQNIPLLPRVLSEYVHSKTGIDIHYAAVIGDSFVIDHGTGIVIGETTVIGNNVIIYQGVTLGALNVAKENAAKKRHPTIEDNVVIYSGTTILGGETVVGRDSIIGGNVWLTKSVAPFSVVFQNAAPSVQDKRSFTEPYNFFI